MTKIELEAENKRLAEAVFAKDEEVAKALAALGAAKAAELKAMAEQTRLSGELDAVRAEKFRIEENLALKDAEVANNKQLRDGEVSKVKEDFGRILDATKLAYANEKEELNKKHEAQINELSGYIATLSAAVGAYRVAHVAVLKNIQGAVESASELNASLEMRFPRPQ